MVARIRLDPTQALRLDRAIDRLEETGIVTRPVAVERILRGRAAVFFVLRRGSDRHDFDHAHTEAARWIRILLLRVTKRIAWFHVERADPSEVPIRHFEVQFADHEATFIYERPE
jgi:hypothetical protein